VKNRYQDWSNLYSSGPQSDTPRRRKPTALIGGATPSQLAYQQYLESDHWRETRAAALLRAKYQCEQCGSKLPPLNVHHLNYRNKGAEKPLDLIVLCKYCHAEQHGKPVASNVPVTRTAFNRSGHVEALGTRVVCGSGPYSNSSQYESATQASRLSQ